MSQVNDMTYLDRTTCCKSVVAMQVIDLLDPKQITRANRQVRTWKQQGLTIELVSVEEARKTPMKRCTCKGARA